MNFPLITAFAPFLNFLLCFHFHLSQGTFISLRFFSLIHWLFRNVLFNFCVFRHFLFSLFFISIFTPLWSEKILHMISVFVNLLRPVLQPTIFSVLENVPKYILEKNEFCCCYIECFVYACWVHCVSSVV